METRVSSTTNEVVIGPDRPTVLVGERINPAGKRKLQEALRANDLDLIRHEAMAQAQAGADIIDINVGTFGVDEVSLLPRAVQLAMATVDIPLCIDSAKPDALDAALRVYQGRALVNSVTGEEKSLNAILPLVKQYGAAVIGLVQDDSGIPTTSERRVAVAHKIVARAEAAGIPREDVLIDCLASSIGADTASGLTVLETIRLIKEELEVNLTLGASNISFGLPDRELINQSFAAIAVALGVTCLITDAAKIAPSILATDLLLARDPYARRYIESYRARRTPR